MGADAADIGVTIHPHPTLSETIGMAAEPFEGLQISTFRKRRRYSQAKRALIMRAMAAQFKTGDSK